MTRCPQCGSQRLYRDGLRYLADGTSVQRWLCRDCSYRFIDPNHKKRRQWKNPPFSLNPPNSLDYNCRGNNDPSRRESTALAAVQTLATVEKEENEKRVAGATTTDQNQTSQREAEIKGKLVEFAWWMKREGYADNTITRRVRLLKTLTRRGANILDPESVKDTIAMQDSWNPKTKELAVEAYSCLLKMLGKTWSPPRFMKVEKLPFIPTKEELDQLIAACNKKVAAFLQLLMETGMRSGEAWRLKWTDFDFTQCVVRVTPEKGGKPRQLKISEKVIAMLKGLPSWGTCDKPFPGSLRHFARAFVRNRAKAASKLGNPRINQITFHTFRHWKATTEYHRTKDLLYVKELLGHRSILSTMTYTQLVNFGEDDFTCKVAKSIDEVKELVEAGFEYVCDYDGLKVFRKRK